MDEDQVKKLIDKVESLERELRETKKHQEIKDKEQDEILLKHKIGTTTTVSAVNIVLSILYEIIKAHKS